MLVGKLVLEVGPAVSIAAWPPEVAKASSLRVKNLHLKDQAMVTGKHE